MRVITYQGIDEEPGILQVSDVWEAAYLAALDIPLLGLEVWNLGSDNPKIVLVFDDCDGQAREAQRGLSNLHPPVPTRPLLRSWKWIRLLVEQVEQGIIA